MPSFPQPPIFTAFTGVDRADLIPEIQALSRVYPIEWGLLIDPDKPEDTLFANERLVDAARTAGGLRLAAHVCGALAREIATDPLRARFDPTGFQRVQVNHSFEGSSPAAIAATRLYGRRFGVRAVLQTRDVFPAEDGVDWLYDVSFGVGVRPTTWPSLPDSGPFCGFSGGLGPATVEAALAAIAAPAGSIYWIDMESQIRTDGLLDLDKCRAVCRAVYGERD
ncbi:MAG TPA: phosphoribosylanthranilate isomerase [Caulobacter sp.]|nr:phosphoribosylanthranilate isomerase [Caulobacter sp.]